MCSINTSFRFFLFGEEGGCRIGGELGFRCCSTKGFYYEELSGEELSGDELSLDGEDSQVSEPLMNDLGDSQNSEKSSVDYDQDYPKYGIIEEDFGDDSFEYAEEDEELLESEKILLEALTSFGESDTEGRDSI